MNPGRLAKRAAERLLGAAFGRTSRCHGRTLILAYHNVVRDADAGRGDQSLHLSFDEFRRHLDLLQRCSVVVPLSAALGEPAPATALRVVLTFDDAYRGAVDLAFPEMVRRGLPATLFVAPGLLGATGFWWDAAAGTTGLDPARRESALEVEAGRPAAEWKRLAPPDRGAAGLPPAYHCASVEAVMAAGAAPGVTLGAHSWSHPNLPRLPEPELAGELRRPLEWLRGTGLPTVPVLAYPYGLSSAAVGAAARSAGYDAGLLVDGGWMPVAGDPMALPRCNVPAGLSAAGLRLRLSGIVAP